MTGKPEVLESKEAVKQAVEEFTTTFQALREEIGKFIVGHQEIVEKSADRGAGRGPRAARRRTGAW